MREFITIRSVSECFTCQRSPAQLTPHPAGAPTLHYITNTTASIMKNVPPSPSISGTASRPNDQSSSLVYPIIILLAVISTSASLFWVKASYLVKINGFISGLWLGIQSCLPSKQKYRSVLRIFSSCYFSAYRTPSPSHRTNYSSLTKEIGSRW